MTDQTVLTVGVGKQFSTINAAIQVADQMGGNADIRVAAGTYTNDGGYLWGGINNVTIEGVGGLVKIVDLTYYAGGKAAIVTGGQNILLKNLDISGVTVPDGNGAGVRYDQGTLTLDNVHLHDNQNGILANADATGSITINNSEIDHNGTSAGNTHNIYIGDVGQFTLTNSYIHDANVGHEVKSRAENNTITNNRILDNSGTSSYSIDLPNGGNAVIIGNVIEQGANGQNHTINAYGEEGNLHAGNNVTFSNNNVINDSATGAGPLWNDNGGTITGTDNTIWNTSDLGNGVNATVTQLSSRPTLDTSSKFTGFRFRLHFDHAESIYPHHHRPVWRRSEASRVIDGGQHGNGVGHSRWNNDDRGHGGGGKQWQLEHNEPGQNQHSDDSQLQPGGAGQRRPFGQHGRVVSAGEHGRGHADGERRGSGRVRDHVVQRIGRDPRVETASSAGPMHDAIDFSGRGITSFAQVQSMMSGSSSAVITIGSGKTITLEGVTTTSLTAADFRFS